jgi:predicted anti-sigma-YlaC factor YlaD
MNCKKIRDLVITDYIDQEASGSVQKEIQAHLKVCAGCRVFEQALREKISDPLKKVQAARPPEGIWQRIQEAMEKEEAAQSASFLRRVSDFLAGSIFKPRPVVVFSSAVIVILVTLLFIQGPFYRHWVAKSYLREQSDYMLSMSTPVNGELEKAIGFGTAIEKAFF